MSVNPHYIWLLLILLIFVSWKSTSVQNRLYGRGPEQFKGSLGSMESFESCSVPPTNFDVTLRSSCRPDEQDLGEFCVKVGCQKGFERGRGPGQDLCYPMCQSGYESNGMSRCYKVCPKGFTTQGTQCVRPKYNFKKDVKPCVGCNPKHKEHAHSDSLSDVWGPTPPQVLSVPVSHYDRIPVVPVQPTVWTTNPQVTHKFYVNDGLNRMSLADQILTENFDGTKSQGSPAPNADKGSTGSMTVAESTQGSAMPEKNIVPSGHREGHCPNGYTLYNDDQCYENCPPHYNDLGTHCELDSYVMERTSYDRGAGTSYRRQRKKFHNLGLQSKASDMGLSK